MVLEYSMNICICLNCKLKVVYKFKFYLIIKNILILLIIGYEIFYWEGVYCWDLYIN